MTTQERIKAAELRIKELQILIQHLKNEKWNLIRCFKHWDFLIDFFECKLLLLLRVFYKI